MFVLKKRNTALNAVAFSPDGRSLVAGGYWGYVPCWNLADRSLRWETKIGTSNHSRVGFGPAGKVLTFNGLLYTLDPRIGTVDGSPGQFHRNSWTTLWEPGPAPVTRAVTAALESRSLACYELPERKRLWSVRLPGDPPAPKAPYYAAPAMASAAAFDARGTAVAVGTVTGSVVVLDAATGKAVAQVRGQGTPVKAVALSPDARRLAFAAGSRLWLYDLLPEPREVACHSLKRRHFSDLAFHPAGEFLASVGGDGIIDRWVPATGERLEALDWGVGKLRAVAFDAAGDRAACCGESGEVVVWDVDR